MVATARAAGAGQERPRPYRLDGPEPPCNEKRLRILAMATEAFLARGFDGANLEDIAIAAGVGKVTIYRLFGDKADLFAQCVIDAITRTAAPLRLILSTERPVENVLTDYAETHIRRMLRPVAGARPFYELTRVLIGASLRHPDLVRSCMAIFRTSLGEPLVAYFRALTDAGRLEGDAAFLAEHFTQSLFFTNAIILDPARAPDVGAVRGIAERTVKLFLHGCAR